MWYVYVIRSMASEFRYIGSTNDVHRLVEKHNEGMNQSTKRYHQFELETYVAVRTEDNARALERYFKSGSGKAVLVKRILKNFSMNT